jgi:starvation-inducible DNA-binding protein
MACSDHAPEISHAFDAVIADACALYLVARVFRPHMLNADRRDFPLLLEEQTEQVSATIAAMVARLREIGRLSLPSTTHLGRLQRRLATAADCVTGHDMLAELRRANVRLAVHLRQVSRLCLAQDDGVTAALLDRWVDEAECRAGFLLEAVRHAEHVGWINARSRLAKLAFRLPSGEMPLKEAANVERIDRRRAGRFGQTRR